MALFRAEPLCFCCADLAKVKQWWISGLGCKQVKVPADRDDPLPSDVALALPGGAEPAILLSDRKEVRQAGLERSSDRAVIFCDRLKKARDYLVARGLQPGPAQDGGGTQFFEICDPEGNVIEICQEP